MLGQFPSVNKAEMSPQANIFGRRANQCLFSYLFWEWSGTLWVLEPLSIALLGTRALTANRIVRVENGANGEILAVNMKKALFCGDESRA